jgi:hypothetical protein
MKCFETGIKKKDMGYVNFSTIISYLFINYITANIIVVDTSFCCTSVVVAAAE